MQHNLKYHHQDTGTSESGNHTFSGTHTDNTNSTITLECSMLTMWVLSLSSWVKKLNNMLR